MNSLNIKYLFIASIKVIAIVMIVLYVWGCQVREKPANLKENLIELCVNIPNNFTKVGSPKTFMKSDRGTYSLSFRSNLSYDEVKDFYSEKFLPKQWEILEEYSNSISTNETTKYLSFHKEGYSIHIETLSDSNSNKEKNYLVNCSWNAY